MKPILLKVSGLQSYRESQEIDFLGLCETGLFGIFGPTGSGKSSLLDAITLAMYGKVERAVNGTQGIMNHSEDSLAVAFTFELASSEGSHRYRVERRFKRTGEQSVSNSVSRFIEIGPDGETVVADKLAEVTRCVEDKIGLKMDDFTRAVVLPQGKFAEFLSLRGVDRRQMLQRLFHLEQYGDQLALKLSRRVKENEAALRAVEAEQQGLGSAGAEDVQAAEERLNEAVRHAAECRERLEAATGRFERFGRIRELQEERTRREMQLLEFRAREEQIASLESRLLKGDEAAKIAPALKAWRSAEEAWRTRGAAAERLESHLAASEQEAVRAAEAEQQAHGALGAEEPALREREGRLRQALELEAELAGLRRELAALAERKGEASRGLEASRETLARERELLAKGQKRQQELQRSLLPLEVRSQERQALQEAMQSLQGLRSAESQWEQAEREWLERAAALGAVRGRLAEAEAAGARLAEARAAAVRNAALHLERAASAEDAAAAIAGRLEQHCAELEAALRERELHRLSLALSRELQDGAPCPVCGSSHHPAPASLRDGGEDPAEERRLQEAKALAGRALEARAGLRSLREQDRAWLEQAYGESGSFSGIPAAAGASLAGTGQGVSGSSQAAAALSREAVSGLTESAPDTDRKPVFGAAAAGSEAASAWPAASGVAELEEQLAGLQSRSKELRREAAQWQEEDRRSQQRLLKETAEAEAARSWEEQTAAKAEELKRQLSVLRQEWERRFPQLAPGEAENAYGELRRKDEEAEEIRGRLDISVKFLEEKSASVQMLQERIAGLDKELAAWTAQHTGKEELLDEKERRLQQWTEGRSAGSLLAECERRLQELQTAAEEGRRRHRAAADRAQQDAREAAIARQAADSAREHCDAAAANWEECLASSPFASADEAEAAALDDGEREAAFARVRSHRDGEAEVKVQLRHIEEKLGGASLTEDEWRECETNLRRCKEDDEAALQAKARGERDLEDLRQRHIRWTELESLRAGHESLQSRLSKLQSCLRGNAFVEYIAEEQLMQVCQAASQRLRFLSRQRYALEVDSGGGFVIRDDGNGGVKRPVSTLSGGETFLTSLSLALALSTQIQLRGQYPLQFFFLDEGFGTLDPELLDTVITSLERLHNDRLSVGIISHVPELRARLARKLIVVPALPGGEGSRILLEKN
ncbi:AAA family ATPase [Paenibacillus sp. URB8-2]|uniref:AAA family ATPase n=1 Tax=Paenibacillus sp. URB8-2 TaxID=2741301 RepID=UPI0015B94764|nr:AAA family ATPase [Paenibacillus sp. URB8-2]BCG60305.1 nuclease SbcCD subunit C [Paenibacillus sp. URB8-2]